MTNIPMLSIDPEYLIFPDDFNSPIKPEPEVVKEKISANL